MYTAPLAMFGDHINKTRFHTPYIVNQGSYKQLFTGSHANSLDNIPP